MTNCSEGKAGTVHPECVGEKHYSDDHGTGSAQKMSKAPDVDLQKDEGGAMPDTTVANALEKADSSDDAERHKKSAEMLAQRKAEQKNKKNQKDRANKNAKKKSDTPEKEGAPKEKPMPSSDGRDKYYTKYKPIQQWDQRTPAERERGDPIPESFQGKRTPMVQETPPAGSTQHPQDQHQYSRKIPGDASGSAPKVATDPEGRVIPTTRKVRDPNAKARKGISSQPVEFKPKVKPAEGEEDPSQKKAGTANQVIMRAVDVINQANAGSGRKPMTPEKAAEVISRFYTKPESLSPKMRETIQGVVDSMTADTATYTNPRLETDSETLGEADRIGQIKGTGIHGEEPDENTVYGDASNTEVKKPNYQQKRGDFNLKPKEAQHRGENITPNPNVGETFTAVIDDEFANRPTNEAEPKSPLFTQRGTPMDQVRETKVAPQKTMQEVGKDMGRIAETAKREAGMPEKRFTPDISGHVQKSTDAKPPSFSELMKSKSDVRYSERGMPSGMHPYGHNFNGQAIPIQNGYRQVFIQRDEPVMPAPGKMKITKN